jgi:DNA polymerase III subunit beta
MTNHAFNITRADLSRALGHVASIVERRSTIPILGHVHVAVSGDNLQLKASDLDMEAVESAPCINAAPRFATCVPAFTLHDLVRKLPDGDIVAEFDASSNRMTLKSGRSRFELPCLDPQDFPSIARRDFSHEVTISSSTVRALFERARFAMSNEETRYYLCGVYLHVSDGRLRAVSTDGHRLARIDVDLPAGADGMPGVIVPRKAVGELLKVAATADEVSLGVSAYQIRVSAGALSVTSKLVDGKFPDYARVIPKGADKVARFDVGAFSTAVDRVSVMSGDKGKGLKLSLFKDRAVMSMAGDAGGAEEAIDAEFNGAPMDIGFNARYLLDIAAQIDGSTMTILLADNSSPALFADEDDADALFLLMPMRV